MTTVVLDSALPELVVALKRQREVRARVAGDRVLWESAAGLFPHSSPTRSS
ncbi:MAG TPA: hypothetical protein VHF24_11305 [Acidimicrobiales bacterium]|nr:hypothetical protein [Acidimicrobiales bacterium]